ncbi:hypothetical protein PXK01_05825 [Phaeobacter sp. PT47_59]|nr:hypothetical protein [Phaeobacter sp. PT47_59]
MLDKAPIARNSLRRRVLKAKPVFAVSLAEFIVSFTRHKANQLCAVKANWANKVDWLAIGCVFPEPENNVVLSGLEHLIPRFFLFESVFLLELLAEVPERFADLHIHHVSRGQFRSEGIQKALNLFIIWRLSTLKQGLDAANGVCRLAGKPNCAGGEADVFANLPNIHRSVPHVFLPYTSIARGVEAINHNVHMQERCA